MYCERVTCIVGLTVLFLIGAPALTSRNFKEEDFVKVIEYLDQGVKIAVEAQSATGRALLEHCFQCGPRYITFARLGHYVGFLGKIIYIHSTSFHLGVSMGTMKC